jgi:hypothetical protein
VPADPRPLSLWLALICVGATGCAQLIFIGTECPELEGDCVQDAGAEPDADAPLEAGPSPDGAQEPMDAARDVMVGPEPDAEPIDAGPSDTSVPAADATADVAPLPFVSLGLKNPDFERNPGVPAGDVVLSDLVDAITLGIVIAELPYWYACWVGSVNSVTWELDQDTGTPPLYRGDYLSLVLNSVFNAKIEPARQRLPMPMQVGTTYSFEVDALGLPDNGAQLFLEIRGHHGTDCNGESALLVRSEPIPDRTWGTLCMQFTAPQAYTHFSIGPTFTGPKPSTNARVRLDTLRQVPACSLKR